MKEINFISGGKMGDFIHSMYAVKHICEKENSKANIYITDNGFYGGDKWTFGAEKAYGDILSTITSQVFVNKFEVLKRPMFEAYTDLNLWRNYVMQDYYSQGFFSKTWAEVLSYCYDFKISKNYKWIDFNKQDNDTKDKIVITRSLQRHNRSFDWNKIINNIEEEIIFLTPSYPEWQGFPFKNKKVKLKVVSTIDEMVIGINSCKYFIGNQSCGFAIASALDVNRLVETNKIDAGFYKGESKYSENISWFLNDNDKYINENSLIKI